MNIVGIGGGTGLPVLLSGLKDFNDSDEDKIDVTAIVAVSDDGGSTGILRRTFDIPAMGDIRNCLLALSSKDPMLTAVCGHRFETQDALNGHSVGNLILSALYQMTGDFGDAVDLASAMLGVKGHILSATEVPLTLCAVYEDGTTVEGESQIPIRNKRVKQVRIEPAYPPPARGVLEALSNADAIVIGPGSLYTSIIPNLLVAGVPGAIQESRALRIYICNLMTQPGETAGFSAADHIRALESCLPERSIDVCILNTQSIGTELAERYQSKGSDMVSVSSESEDEIRRMGVIPIAVPLLKEGDTKVRHDPAGLAGLVVSLARGVTGSHEMFCSRVNGR